MRTTRDWEAELRGWLEPFLERSGHKARRRMCPLYVAGLIGPGDRKSVQPMAERFAPNDYDQLHANGVHLEVTRDTDGPDKLASREPLAEWRAHSVTGIRQYTTEADTG